MQDELVKSDWVIDPLDSEECGKALIDNVDDDGNCDCDDDESLIIDLLEEDGGDITKDNTSSFVTFRYSFPNMNYYEA